MIDASMLRQDDVGGEPYLRVSLCKDYYDVASDFQDWARNGYWYLDWMHVEDMYEEVWVDGVLVEDAHLAFSDSCRAKVAELAEMDNALITWALRGWAGVPIRDPLEGWRKPRQGLSDERQAKLLEAVLAKLEGPS